MHCFSAIDTPCNDVGAPDLHLRLYKIMQEKALIIGALGQVGRELYEALEVRLGSGNVLATDVKPAPDFAGEFETLDVLDTDGLLNCLKRHRITEVYNLAALLSATAEKHPEFAWKLTMDGQFNILNAAKEGLIKKIFWPSSIAVFGPNTPKNNTPQHTIIEPATVYGIGKLAGEMWNQYYHQKYGVDVRGVRYPGLIGWKSMPGGGTTDYAVDIFYYALRGQTYNCFLQPDAVLPMMHMEDAIRATLQIMDTPASLVQLRTCYNIAAMSFDPAALVAEIQKHLPGFEATYTPDFRQSIAQTWPRSIDDREAREHWGWKEKYDLPALVSDMFHHLKERISA
jgi:nucleoside-diphosphate-sugar epimerase